MFRKLIVLFVLAFFFTGCSALSVNPGAVAIITPTVSINVQDTDLQLTAQALANANATLQAQSVVSTSTPAPTTDPLVATIAALQATNAALQNRPVTATLAANIVPTALPTQAMASTVAPTVNPLASQPNTFVLANYVQNTTIDNMVYSLIMGTTHRTDHSITDYYAMANALIPSSSSGWCKGIAPDCPPWTYLWNVTGNQSQVGCMTVEMEVATRFHIQNFCAPTNELQTLIYNVRFNSEFVPASGQTLEAAYLVNGSNYDNGIFIGNKSDFAAHGNLILNGVTTPFGYICAICRPNTAGPATVSAVAVNDPRVTHMDGPATMPDGACSDPAECGQVIAVPHPNAQPNWHLTFTLQVPYGESYVFVGAFDLDAPLPTPTPAP